MPDYFTVSHISRKDLARIFSKIKVSTERFYNGAPCWEWQGSQCDGYGYVKWEGKNRRAHRILYAWVFGPIPHKGAKVEIDHLCKNRPCINPCHTDLVTSQVNSLRSNNMAARYAVRTHCNQGHEFCDENTHTSLSGSRRCRICKNEDAKRRRHEGGSSERERSRLAMREHRAMQRDNPEWQEKQRKMKRDTYARQKQNPEWVQRERQRLRDLYHRQKSR